jgi:fibronectin-binding autotransporter adhesin
MTMPLNLSKIARTDSPRLRSGKIWRCLTLSAMTVLGAQLLLASPASAVTLTVGPTATQNLSGSSVFLTPPCTINNSGTVNISGSLNLDCAFNNKDTGVAGGRGQTNWSGNSNPGTSVLNNDGPASKFDFSATTGFAGDGQLTAGAIAGSGFFWLGSNTLTVGSANTDTTVSGVIQDGGAAGGTGGSLVKTGTGTLTLSGKNTYTGSTTVLNGTLQAGAVDTFSPDSAIDVTANGTLDLNNFSQKVAGLTNAGTVNMGTTPGTVLTVNGNYVGNGGTIYMNTVFGGDSSATDKLIITGTPSGTTTIDFTNVGGLGAATSTGILIVETNTTTNIFGLQRNSVVLTVGGFDYRLVQVGTKWYLRNNSGTSVNSSAAPVPTLSTTQTVLLMLLLMCIGAAALGLRRMD